MLPVLTLSLWEQTIGFKAEILKWKDLENFLTLWFQSLESVSEIQNFELVGSRFRSASETFFNLKKGVRSFSTKLNRKFCKFCAGDHLINICPTFLELSPER